MLVSLIRFTYGYVVIRISGSRPGTFVNKLVRCGMNVWGIRSHEGDIICRIRLSDTYTVMQMSRDSSCRVRIVKKRGLPFILYKNKRRSGLVFGAAAAALIFYLLSLSIWNINICEFDTMSRTAVLETLHRVGFYEGVRGEFESLKRMQTSALLEFGNLSWITLNADGSFGEVNATEKLMIETTDNAPANIKARCDGYILRVDPYMGVPVVSAGDGVVKGNLLISGIIETENDIKTVRANGAVIAQTHSTERFVIPRLMEIKIFDDAPVKRYSCRLFGVIFPLTIGEADRSSLSFIKESQASYRGERASVSLITQELYGFTNNIINVDEAAASNILYDKMLLREMFRYCDKEIIDRQIERTVNKDEYIYDIYYICVEDIAMPEKIRFSENFFNSGIDNEGEE